MHARAPSRWTEARAMLALAYPLILTNLSQGLIGATDVILLGRAGPGLLAAGALGTNIVTAFVMFGIGLVGAASPMIARALGERPFAVREVRRTVRAALWASVAMVVPFWALLWHADAILLAFGQRPDLAAGAARLVRPMMIGLLPLYAYNVLRAFVSALERPLWSFVAGGTAVVTNAVGNYALIFGRFGLPALGLEGAGIGSAISNTVMFLILATVVTRDRRFRRYRLFGRWWRSDWARLAALCRLGVPIAIATTVEISAFNAAVFLMGLIGTAELAAHAIAIQIATLCFMLPLGLSQAATVRVGLAFGRRDAAGVARAGRTALAITLATMTATATLLLVAAHPLIRLFLDPREAGAPRVTAFAVSFLTVAALFQMVDGLQAVGAGMLRGLHDTRVPMLFSLFGYWLVGLGTAVLFAFPLGWGGIGVWFGLAAGLATAAALMVGRWLRRDGLGLVPG